MHRSSQLRVLKRGIQVPQMSPFSHKKAVRNTIRYSTGSYRMAYCITFLVTMPGSIAVTWGFRCCNN